MADLQCAATVIVLPGDAAADPGRVLAERPACLVTDPAARQAGARLAADLDVPVRVLDDDASSGGLVGALDAIADEFRGECVVLVLAPATYVEIAERLLPAGSAAGAVVEIDADGRRWRPWPLSAPTGR